MVEKPNLKIRVSDDTKFEEVSNQICSILYESGLYDSEIIFLLETLKTNLIFSRLLKEGDG